MGDRQHLELGDGVVLLALRQYHTTAGDDNSIPVPDLHEHVAKFNLGGIAVELRLIPNSERSRMAQVAQHSLDLEPFLLMFAGPFEVGLLFGELAKVVSQNHSLSAPG